MLVNNEVKEKKNQAELKDISESNKKLTSVVGIRITNEQLHKLKKEAIEIVVDKVNDDIICKAVILSIIGKSYSSPSLTVKHKLTFSTPDTV
jgi:uncharacterized radical SAM superfamily protein